MESTENLLGTRLGLEIVDAACWDGSEHVFGFVVGDIPATNGYRLADCSAYQGAWQIVEQALQGISWSSALRIRIPAALKHRGRE